MQRTPWTLHPDFSCSAVLSFSQAPSLPSTAVSLPTFVLICESVVYVTSSAPNTAAPTFPEPWELPLQSWAQLLESRDLTDITRLTLAFGPRPGFTVTQNPGNVPAWHSGAGFLQSHLAWQSLSFFVLDDIGVPENNGWQLLKHLWNVEFSDVSSWIGLGYTFSVHFWQECFMMDACLPQWFTSDGRWCHLVLLSVGDINFGRSIHSVSPRSLCCKGSISL